MVTDVLFLCFLHTADTPKLLALARSLSLLWARMISTTLLGAVGRASSPLHSINVASRFKRWPYPNWQMGNSPPPQSHSHTHASFLFTAYFPNATFVSVYTKDWSHQLWNIVQMGFTPEWVAAGGYGLIFTFIFVGQIWRTPACLFHHAGLVLKRWGKITPSNTVGELYGHKRLLSSSLAQIWPSDIVVLIGTCPKWHTWCELMVLRTRNGRRVCCVHETVGHLICHFMIQNSAYWTACVLFQCVRHRHCNLTWQIKT